MRNRTLVLYCILVFGLSWSAQFALLAFYGSPNNPAAVLPGLGIMFSPALVTLGFALFSREVRKQIRWRPAWRMIPILVVAIVVPILIGFATLAVVEFASWGKAGWFAFSQSIVTISGGPWLLGEGAQNWTKFIANVLLTGGYFAAYNGLFAVGEELGWRGFLQGVLVARLGVTRGIGLLGLIWSLWHLPVLLAGYNYPEHPILGALVLFPVQLVAASFFLGWLTIRAGSFWPAALAHGAVNSIQEGVTANIRTTVPHLYEDLTRLSFTVLFGLVFWLLLRRRPNGRATAPQSPRR